MKLVANKIKARLWKAGKHCFIDDTVKREALTLVFQANMKKH